MTKLEKRLAVIGEELEGLLLLAVQDVATASYLSNKSKSLQAKFALGQKVSKRQNWLGYSISALLLLRAQVIRANQNKGTEDGKKEQQENSVVHT